MDILHTLEKQHHEVDVLFERLAKSEEKSKKQRVLITILNNLAAHMDSEEEVFYPAARKIDLKEVSDALKEHGDIRKKIKMLGASLRKDESEQLTQTTDDLRKAVTHHVHEEETELFPILRQEMPYGERVLLNDRYLKAFEQHLEEGVIPFTPIPSLHSKEAFASPTPHA